MAEALEGHQVVDLDRARLADAAQVVAPEVDEHDVLGALLGIGHQVLAERLVAVGPPAARARDGAHRRGAIVEPHHDLGAGADQLEVAPVEEEHVRARVDGAQRAVEREGIARIGGAQPLRADELEDVPGPYVLLGLLDHRAVAFARQGRVDDQGLGTLGELEGLGDEGRAQALDPGVDPVASW
ncbi:hypothetical protein D3C86_1519050 [compost metagenome]